MRRGMIIALLGLSLTVFTTKGTASESKDRLRAQVDSLSSVITTLQEDVERVGVELDSLRLELDAIEADAAAEVAAPESEEADAVNGEPEVPDSTEVSEPELVIISDEVGAEIDKEERDRYGLFTSVNGFVSASYFKLPDGTYEVRVEREDSEGKMILSKNAVAFAGIEFVRSRIGSRSSE